MALPGKTRASVKIQEGCDQVCAYCIVPRVRGRERSIPPGDLIEQVRRLVSEGCPEVILTGTQLGTYGFDLEGHGLSRLLAEILDRTEIARIRVSSLQPLEISGDLLETWQHAGGRLCPHFHIPLQSGSDAILTAMRRRYTREQFIDAVDRVRSAIPGCSVTTDIICGFPGESPQNHESTLRLVETVQFADAHVFPYSGRPGTTAAHMDGHIAPVIKAERATGVRELTSRHSRGFRLASVGELRPVLWEGADGLTGLTDNYLRVKAVNGYRGRRGEIDLVRLAGVGPDGILTVGPASAPESSE
jgi:threonylcarbamoyladenosine tRNA methylthiotransferase MtaB